MFEDDRDRERFYGLLDHGVRRYDVACHQDVLMGNHVHLVLAGPIEEVSGLMWFVNGRYAVAYNRRHGRINHLIGRRFHCSEITGPRIARTVAIYVALNPVRAGLVEHPSDWSSGSYRANIGVCRPRPHVATGAVDEAFARIGTTLREAVEDALAAGSTGRPKLTALLPSLDELTETHVRHAQQLFGYTLDDIARHYGVSLRTLRRRLAVA